METKLIKLFANAEPKELTFEEVLFEMRGVIRNSIHSFLGVNRRYCFDDCYQEVCISLIKAYEIYKLPYSFAGLTKKFAYYSLINYMRKEVMYYKNMFSIDEPVAYGKNGEELTIADTLGEEDRNLLSYAEVDNVKLLLDALSERQRDELISFAVNEETKKSLAEKYNTSIATFNKRSQQTMNRFRMLFMKCNEDNDQEVV